MLVFLNNVVFKYPDAQKTAVRNISFSIKKGEYLAILGANGSGKSTLARCLAGLLVPDSGSIVFSDKANTITRALVFQNPQDQLVAESVEFDIAFGPENIGLDRPTMHARVSEALDTFSLIENRETKVQDLSLGLKQHLALAGAIALQPSLLILDEPTSMLSPLARQSLLSFLDSFCAKGGSIIHITHDLDEAERAERVIVLEDGQIVFDNEASELKKIPDELLLQWGLAARFWITPQIKREPTFHKKDAPLLQAQNLCAGPVRNLSFSLMRGSLTMIIGESGSGKSFLLEVLAGISKKDSGSIFTAKDISIALAVQESESSLFEEFIADDIAFGPKNQGLKGKPLVERVHQAMDLVGLPFDLFKDRQTFSLSGGERRKAALAGILAMDTDIVLFDEPSSALDVKSRGQLMEVLLELRKQGKAVVCSTNRLEECIIADRVIELSLEDAPDQQELADTEKTADIPTDQQTAGAQKIAGMTATQQTADTAIHSGSPAEESEQAESSPEIRSLARLKVGAQGAYTKMDSLLHRQSPLSKFILAFSCIATAVGIKGLPAMLLLIALELIPLFLSRYPLKKLFFSVLRVLPWLLFFGAIQIAFNPADLFAPIIFILRFIALLIPLSIFVFTTGQTEIMYGVEDVLSLLKIFKISVRDFALVIGIVFRFTSLLYEEARRISIARIVRSPKNLKKISIRSSVSLFVPLMIRTLTRADQLSQAIIARYYGKFTHSRYVVWNPSFLEKLTWFLLPLGAILFIAISHL